MSDVAPVLKASPPLPVAAPDASAATRTAVVDRDVAAPPVDDAPRSPGELQNQLDRIIENADTSLRFRVDEQSQRVVVAVIDAKGEVIMQVPDQAALAVARQLAKNGTLLNVKA